MGLGGMGEEGGDLGSWSKGRLLLELDQPGVQPSLRELHVGRAEAKDIERCQLITIVLRACVS